MQSRYLRVPTLSAHARTFKATYTAEVEQGGETSNRDLAKGKKPAAAIRGGDAGGGGGGGQRPAQCRRRPALGCSPLDVTPTRRVPMYPCPVRKRSWRLAALGPSPPVR